MSHSAKNKEDISKLRNALDAVGVDSWEDVLELRLGDSLDGLKGAIDAADGFVLLLTPASISSTWVQREVAWAIAAKAKRPEYVLSPILRGLGRDALGLFGAASLISIELGPTDAIEAAVPAILQALGLAPVLPRPPKATEQAAPALADLVIELSRPRMVLCDGTRRPVAEARVVYVPSQPGQRGIEGAWRELEAPLGAREADDLRWYLEEYPLWPFGLRRDRAAKTEADLPAWGKRLFGAAALAADRAFLAWRNAGRVERRITILIDDRGPPEGETERHEAAAKLLALPWELLHDEVGYLFEGANGARVRRRLPSNDAVAEVPPAGLPLRVLYVLSRPEDTGVSFLDPRTSLMPLTEVLATLGHAVALTVLPDGSFQALDDALRAAREAATPYHVVHFDGHGVYDPQKGLGALAFEDAEDARKSELTRKMDLVPADRIGATLRDHRVPLFVLEACESAKTDEQPHASVAAALLRAGVASVVAMSHAVLVATARRFVEAFYSGLVAGQRIGTAMASAQRALRHNRTRMENADSTRVELDDWLVPVLFQEGDADPALVPGGADLSPAARDLRQREVEHALGALPKPPAHAFVGRGRELLAIERLLHKAKSGHRVVSIVGPGGLGKTSLAGEAARFLLAIRRVERIAFAAVDAASDARGVIAVLGTQLVPGYTIATAEGAGREDEKLHNALLPIEQKLWNSRALLVIDNLESVLPLPGAETSDDVKTLFSALGRLAKAGETRILLTSREDLPAGLCDAANGMPLGRLGRIDAVDLLSAVLRQEGRTPAKEAEKEQVEALVDVVGGHARSLVLLGAEVALRGAVKTSNDVRDLMRKLEARHPYKNDEQKRELSLLASVRLSLRRLPEAVQRQIRPLAVFHGPAHAMAIAHVLQIETKEAIALCWQLMAVGLAGANGSYLLPDAALGAALDEDLAEDERAAAQGRWLEALDAFVCFLYEQRGKDPHVAFHGARVALVDLLAGLDTIVSEVEAGRYTPERGMDFAGHLEDLMSPLGVPRALQKIVASRRLLNAKLRAWGRARFNAEVVEIKRMQEIGDLRSALTAAFALRDRTEAAGDAYERAEYDRAIAWWKLGQVLQMGARSEQALGVLREAEKRFGALTAPEEIENAAKMAASTMTDQGDALVTLGQLDEAAAMYANGIKRHALLGDWRAAAVGRGQLGTVLLEQGRLVDALTAFIEARDTFAQMGESASVGVTWHQIGMVHHKAGRLDAAESAFRESLVITVAAASRAHEASTLDQLGQLYGARDRLEEAATHFCRAVEIFRELGDAAAEARSLNNFGLALYQLRRLDQACAALYRAAELKKDFGPATLPWTTWTIIAKVEGDAGRPEAAAKAHAQAIATYRPYREDGGEPMEPFPRFVAAFGEALRTQGPDAARGLVAQHDDYPDWFQSTLRAMEAIAAGHRDPSLVDDLDLPPMHTVELQLLLASLATPST